jgi:protoporphyrinogen/coproporphyrinogen III oxidase
MKRVAIIGGGIAGLSAAYYLERARRSGADIEWALFEKSDRLGGVIQTEQREGYILEAGPDSFLTAKSDGAQLCRELGIGDQLIGSNDAGRKTYIVVKGKLLPIPEGLEFMVPTRVMPMMSTRLFSLSTKLRMAKELFSEQRDRKDDESVGEFVRRHFGPEMVERVAEPLLAGVYGGDADTLSVKAVLPRFVEMEREQGSLVRATLRARKSRTQAGKNTGAAPQPLFSSLKGGMQQMVDALLAALPAASTRLRQEGISLQRSGNTWHVADPSGTRRFDNVLLAVPAPVAAELLRAVQPELAGMLQAIAYTSSAAIALAYDQAPANLPPGFGFLVPRAEGRQMLACTFVHKKFSHRAPWGAALLRCFISSSRVPELLSYTDEQLQEIVLRELKEVLRLSTPPRFMRVFRWQHALPQYHTGHLQRVAEMEKLLQKLPGIHIIGNSFYGIGIPDCIRSARQAVEAVTSSALQPASV